MQLILIHHLKNVLKPMFGEKKMCPGYDVYKTKKFAKPKQIIYSIIGTKILVYILYKGRSDN